MYIYKRVSIIPAPPESVFDYLTTARNFPVWLKEVLIAGKAYGEPALGSTMVQTIRIMMPRKFSMHITGFVKNRYFRIEALKGFALLPGFSFSLKPAKGNATEMTTYVQIKCRGDESLAKTLRFLYPCGVDQYWELYLSLFAKAIDEKEKELTKAGNKRGEITKKKISSFGPAVKK